MTQHTMGCEEALRLLATYLDRELNPLEEMEMERHLELCRSCYSRVEFERALKARLAELGHLTPDPAFADRIRQMVQRFRQLD